MSFLCVDFYRYRVENLHKLEQASMILQVKPQQTVFLMEVSRQQQQMHSKPCKGDKLLMQRMQQQHSRCRMQQQQLLQARRVTTDSCESGVEVLQRSCLQKCDNAAPCMRFMLHPSLYHFQIAKSNIPAVALSPTSGLVYWTYFIDSQSESHCEGEFTASARYISCSVF